MSEHNCGIWYKKGRKRINYSNKKKKMQNIFFKNIFKLGTDIFLSKSDEKNDRNIIKTFQQRYLPRKVTGKIDQKTLEISSLLANKVFLEKSN